MPALVPCIPTLPSISASLGAIGQLGAMTRLPLGGLKNNTTTVGGSRASSNNGRHSNADSMQYERCTFDAEAFISSFVTGFNVEAFADAFSARLALALSSGLEAGLARMLNRSEPLCLGVLDGEDAHPSANTVSNAAASNEDDSFGSLDAELVQELAQNGNVATLCLTPPFTQERVATDVGPPPSPTPSYAESLYSVSEPDVAATDSVGISDVLQTHSAPPTAPPATVFHIPTPPTQRWYIITVGLATGVFRGWHNVAPFVVNVRGTVFHRVESEEAGWEQFRQAEADGHTRIIHP